MKTPRSHRALLVATALFVFLPLLQCQSNDSSDKPNPFEVAARNPNASRSVSFTGYDLSIPPNVTANNVYGTIDNGPTWTLTVNVTDVLVDNNTAFRTYTSLNFDRLPGGKLPHPNDTGWNLCAHVLSFPFPKVTNEGDQNDNDPCASVLGSECVEAYSNAIQFDDFPRSSSGCPDFRIPSWDEVAECKSEIEYASSITYSLRAVENYEGFYSSYSPSTYALNETTYLLDAAQTVEWLLLTARPYNWSENGSYPVPETKTVCIAAANSTDNNGDLPGLGFSGAAPRSGAALLGSATGCLLLVYMVLLWM